MKLQEVTAYNLKSETILNESWDMLTESQRLHIGAWENRVWPLMEEINRLLEADLTADQIQQIFSNAEKLSVEQGTGLTALGKAGKVTAEVSGKIKTEIEKLLDQAKNSEPVKNMDAQFDKLRSQIGTSVKGMKGGDKILQGVDKWRKFAEENPAKQAFIIGAMTSLLAFASGGVMSGAAIGFFLRLANNTLKGDQLSTAIGKGVRGAAIGAVAGAIGGALSDNIEISSPEVEGGEVEVSASIESDAIADSSEEVESTAAAFEDMTVEEYRLQYAEQIAERLAEQNGVEMSQEMIQKMADNVTVQGNYPDGNFVTRFEGNIVRGNIYLTPEELQEWNKVVNSDDPFAPNGVMGDQTTEWLKNNVEGAQEQFDASAAADAAAQEELTARYNEMSPEEQKAYDDRQRKFLTRMGDSPSEYEPPGTPKYTENESLLIAKNNITESLWDEFELYEAGFADTMKKAAAGAAKIGQAAGKGLGKAAQATAAKAAQGAQRGVAAVKAGAGAAKKEIGQKVTVRKLNSLWKKMGSPTDAGSIANLLSDAGMNDEQIGTVAQQNKVDLPAPTKTASPAAGEKDQAADQQTDQSAKPNQAANQQTTTSSTPIDIKSLAQEIKQLPKTSIKQVKDELTKELNKTAAKPSGKTGSPQRPQGGGKVSNQLSQTPNAIRKRQQRTASKAAPQPKAVAPNTQK